MVRKDPPLDVRLRQIEKQRSAWMKGFQEDKRKKESQSVSVPVVPKKADPEVTIVRKTKLTSQLTSQVASQKCGVCLDLMIPPKKCPILLFPCGHTFCKQCLTLHKENNNFCPSCRTEFVSEAVNQSLKQVMEAYACTLDYSQQEAEEEAEDADRMHEQDQQQQMRDLESFILRKAILTREKDNIKRQDQDILNAVEKLKREEEVFVGEKDDLIAQIDAIRQKVAQVEERINGKQQQQKRVLKSRTKLEEKTKLIDNTITSLQEDMEKIKNAIKQRR